MRALAAALALAGCATGPRRGDTAVVRQTAAAERSPEEAFGAQVYARDVYAARYHGELLACDDRGVFVLLNELGPSPYVRLEWASLVGVWRVREGFGGAFATWTTIGTLSTLSHGLWAGISAPLWLLAGIPSSLAAGNTDARAEGCDALRPYARFPQGMPDAFRRSHFGAAADAPVAPWATPGAR